MMLVKKETRNIDIHIECTSQTSSFSSWFGIIFFNLFLWTAFKNCVCFNRISTGLNLKIQLKFNQNSDNKKKKLIQQLLLRKETIKNKHKQCFCKIILKTKEHVLFYQNIYRTCTNSCKRYKLNNLHNTLNKNFSKKHKIFMIFFFFAIDHWNLIIKWDI